MTSLATPGWTVPSEQVKFGPPLTSEHVPWEVAIVPWLNPVAGQVSATPTVWASEGPALFSGEPLLLSSADAWLVGVLAMVSPAHVPALLGRQPLVRPSGYTGHGSLLVCDVRAGPYPPLHQGGSPLRNPQKTAEVELRISLTEVPSQVQNPRSKIGNSLDPFLTCKFATFVDAH